MNAPNSFLGLPVTFSEYALEATDVRLFPASKHRSKRIVKKLVKRFGGEFKKQPCIWKTPQGFIVHPALREQLIAATTQRREE